MSTIELFREKLSQQLRIVYTDPVAEVVLPQIVERVSQSNVQSPAARRADASDIMFIT